MMRHLAGRHLTGHQEAEHVIGRHARADYARILPESNTAVEDWISHQNTPACPPRAQ